MPHYGVPVILPTYSKKTTGPEPFSFHERDVQTQEKKAKKIEDVIEQEKKGRPFKANPMPNLDGPSGLPMKEIEIPTQPEPFNMW